MAVQVITTIILARNLSAQDYGIVGFANVIMSFLGRVNSFGLPTAIIQRKTLDDTVLGTAVSLNILLSIVAFLLAQLAAPLAGWLLDSPASVTVVRVLAFGFLLTPIGFVSTCQLNREMRFGALRGPSVAGALVRGVVSVSTAVTGWSYWSLVAGNLAGSITANGVLQAIYPSKLRWNIDWPMARQLLAQGLPLTLTGLVTFALLNADNFFIGSIAGATLLGYYSIALNWSTFGATALQDVVHRVLFPKFSRMQDDLTAMREGFLRTLRIVSFGSFFINAALFVVAEGFLFHVLGKGTDRWLPAAGALQILCGYGAIRASIETVANPVLALGDFKLLLRCNAAAAVLEISLLPLTLKHFGIEGVGLLVTVAYTSQCVFLFPYLHRRLGVNYTELLFILSPILLAALGGVALASMVSFGDALEWKVILLKLTVHSAGFIIIHELLSRGAILGEIRQMWGSLRPTRVV